MVPTARSDKTKERTCAACRERVPPDELVRWVRGDDGAVVPDLQARAFGRGAWLHARLECLKKLQPALQKSFKAPVTTTTPEALALLGLAATHRVGQLLGQGRQQGALVYGSDRVAEEWRSGAVAAVVVALDARAAGESDTVRDAITQGQACAWGSKAELGALFGRAEIGVLGVTDRGLARRLFGAIAMALLVRTAPVAAKSSGAWKSLE